jgi:hypothetical protein
MAYNNFSISAGKGRLYLKSKTPQEGYEKVTYGTNGENVTYHKYVDSIKGKPTNFEVKEISYEGKTLKFLELTLSDGDDSNKVSVPLKNSKGGYTDEVRSLLSAMNGLELGEDVTLSVKSTTTTGKNGKDYKNLNIYINYVNRLGENGKGLSTGFISYSDIPAPEKKVVAGDTVYDWTPQTEFFYTKLQEIQGRFQSGATQQPQQTESPKNSVETKVPTATPEQAFEPAQINNKPKDELPF